MSVRTKLIIALETLKKEASSCIDLKYEGTLILHIIRKGSCLQAIYDYAGKTALGLEVDWDESKIPLFAAMLAVDLYDWDRDFEEYKREGWIIPKWAQELRT